MAICTSTLEGMGAIPLSVPLITHEHQRAPLIKNAVMSFLDNIKVDKDSNEELAKAYIALLNKMVNTKPLWHGTIQDDVKAFLDSICDTKNAIKIINNEKSKYPLSFKIQTAFDPDVFKFDIDSQHQLDIVTPFTSDKHCESIRDFFRSNTTTANILLMSNPQSKFGKAVKPLNALSFMTPKQMVDFFIGTALKKCIDDSIDYDTLTFVLGDLEKTGLAFVVQIVNLQYLSQLTRGLSIYITDAIKAQNYGLPIQEEQKTIEQNE